jgi:thermitase
VLVGFSSAAVHATAQLTTLQAQVMEPLDLRGAVDATDGASWVGYRLSVPAGEEWATIDQLRQNPVVAFAEPNWLVFAAQEEYQTVTAQPETAFVLNDPAYFDQQWYLQRINASRAWALALSEEGFQGKLTTVQVAIVDSGIDVNHPEFADILLDGENYIAPGSRPIDKFGHGTHVAGLIGALANNERGIVGVATKVRLDPRKVLDDNGSGSITNVANGIRDAADAGAQIINLSLETSVASETLRMAVDYAASKGALLIAAAGNTHPLSVQYPAAFESVMAIAATTYADQRSSYSNTGTEIEMAAPGGAFPPASGDRSPPSVYSTWAKDADCRDNKQTLPQSGYCTSEGTSMAAALVSGAAALIWSLNPDLSAADVRQLLRETATPIAGNQLEVGSGRLDVHAALRKLLPSDLLPSQREISLVATTFDQPYTVTVRLENPSGEPINWEAGLVGNPSWVKLAGAVSGVVIGSVRYAAPDYLSFVISPTTALTGVYAATAQIVGNRADNTQVVRTIPLKMRLGKLTNRLLLPMLLSNGATAPAPAWETPIDEEERQLVTLTDESSQPLTLPFAFPLQGNSYLDLQINANGFVHFPANEVEPSLPNRCMPNRQQPAQAIYGWWTDLDPGATGARVSHFQPATDRYVIEYDNVPTSLTVSATYTVSFQIVLYRNGDVGLNYRQASSQLALPSVTIGVEAYDGLFYNLVVCKDEATELGYLPSAGQSFLLKAQTGVY